MASNTCNDGIDSMFNQLKGQLELLHGSVNSNTNPEIIETYLKDFVDLFSKVFDHSKQGNKDEKEETEKKEEKGYVEKVQAMGEEAQEPFQVITNEQQQQPQEEELRASQSKTETMKSELPITKNENDSAEKDCNEPFYDEKDNSKKQDVRGGWNEEISSSSSVVIKDWKSAKMSTATISQLTRQMIQKVLYVLLAHHPNGVYDSELSVEYKRMINEELQMNDTVEYLLFNHRSILITPFLPRGNLLTLHPQVVEDLLEECNTHELTRIVCKHVETIVKLFPCGLLVDIFDEMMFNFYGYALSQLYEDPQDFVVNCCRVFVDKSKESLVYFPLMNPSVMDSRSRTQPKLQNQSTVLSSPIGYRELFIALLAHYKTAITTQQLESEFEQLFEIKLNACAPIINRILKKINDPTINQQQKELQLKHVSNMLANRKSSQGSTRSSLRNSYNSYKSMINKFRLATNYELYFEKHCNLFELFCPKCQQHTILTKSPFKEDHKVVFMGGFVRGTSVKDLQEELRKYNVKVIDCKAITYSDYGWSFVKLETAQQAEHLIACSPISIGGHNIDVRPFIDRKRVKNHQRNRPTDVELLNSVLQAVKQAPSGLTVGQVQITLFHTFQFRVDGPEIIKLVCKNAKLLQIKRYPVEKIILTPKLPCLTSEELKSKIVSLFTDNSYKNTEEKSNTIISSSAVSDQRTISLSEFENDFARRYKAYLDPQLYGHHALLDLLLSMNDVLHVTYTNSTCPMVMLASQPSTQIHQQQQQAQQQAASMLGSLWPTTSLPILSNNPQAVSGNTNEAQNLLLFNPHPSQMPMVPSGSTFLAPASVYSTSTQTYLQNVVPQVSSDLPNALPISGNLPSLEVIAQQPLFLDLSGLSTRSSGSQSPRATKQCHVKFAVNEGFANS